MGLQLGLNQNRPCRHDSLHIVNQKQTIKLKFGKKSYSPVGSRECCLKICGTDIIQTVFFLLCTVLSCLFGIQLVWILEIMLVQGSSQERWDFEAVLRRSVIPKLQT